MSVLKKRVQPRRGFEISTGRLVENMDQAYAMEGRIALTELLQEQWFDGICPGDVIDLLCQPSRSAMVAECFKAVQDWESKQCRPVDPPPFHPEEDSS